MIHGIIGAGMGAISDGEALAGFIGGVVGEVVGEAYADTHPEGFNPDAEDFDPSLRESLKNRGKILTQVSAALAAAFLGENPNVAACTALNAVSENAFSPYCPTPLPLSQDQIGDVVEAVVKNSRATSDQEAVTEMAIALQDKLPGLGLTAEQAEIMAIECVSFARETRGDFSIDDMNAIALRTFIDIRRPSLGDQFFEAATEYINGDIDFHADLGEDFGSSLGTFFSDDDEITKSFGGIGRKFGIAVGMIGMIPNPASLTKKAIVEGIKQTAKAEVKKEVKATAKKKTGRSGKQQRLKEMMADDKLGRSDRGWLKNDARHIKTDNKKALRIPRNGRKAPGRKAKDKGYELAHPHEEPASQGNSYASAKLKNAKDHKVETRLHQNRY